MPNAIGGMWRRAWVGFVRIFVGLMSYVLASFAAALATYELEIGIWMFAVFVTTFLAVVYGSGRFLYRVMRTPENLAVLRRDQRAPLAVVATLASLMMIANAVAVLIGEREHWLRALVSAAAAGLAMFEAARELRRDETVAAYATALTASSARRDRGRRRGDPARRG